MKYALVTGSSSGIGRAIAEKFLSEGCFVFINYFPGEDTASLEKEMETHYKGQYSLCPADLSGFEGLNALASCVEQETEWLDYLVLNAGVTNRASLDDITYDEWERVFAINLTIPFFLVQRLQPRIPEHGRIIFMGSMMGVLPHSLSLAYGVSKAGVNFLAQNLTKFFEGRNITVNAIAPGFVDTPWQKEKSAQIRQNIEDKVALHRFATPGEIASLCWYLTQNEYINGTVIPIHGGYNYR